jgi:hypothetical protein
LGELVIVDVDVRLFLQKVKSLMSASYAELIILGAAGDQEI